MVDAITTLRQKDKLGVSLEAFLCNRINLIDFLQKVCGGRNPVLEVPQPAYSAYASRLGHADVILGGARHDLYGLTSRLLAILAGSCDIYIIVENKRVMSQ
jgi:hypothetical protein